MEQTKALEIKKAIGRKQYVMNDQTEFKNNSIY